MNKKNLLLTTIVCMFPLILGVVLYSELPLKIAIHWDSTGIADRYCNKLLAIIGLPIFFALINLVVLLYTHLREIISYIIKIKTLF